MAAKHCAPHAPAHTGWVANTLDSTDEDEDEVVAAPAITAPVATAPADEEDTIAQYGSGAVFGGAAYTPEQWETKLAKVDTEELKAKMQAELAAYKATFEEYAVLLRSKATVGADEIDALEKTLKSTLDSKREHHRVLVRMYKEYKKGKGETSDVPDETDDDSDGSDDEMQVLKQHLRGEADVDSLLKSDSLAANMREVFTALLPEPRPGDASGTPRWQKVKTLAGTEPVISRKKLLDKVKRALDSHVENGDKLRTAVSQMQLMTAYKVQQNAKAEIKKAQDDLAECNNASEMKAHLQRLKDAIATYETLLRWYFALTQELARHADTQITQCNAIIAEYAERSPENTERALALVVQNPATGGLMEHAAEFQATFNTNHPGITLALPLTIDLDDKNEIGFKNGAGGAPELLVDANAALVLDEAYKMVTGKAPYGVAAVEAA